MKKVILSLAIWLLFLSAISQNPVYKQVKVLYSVNSLELLSANGFAIDYVLEGGYILLSLNRQEMELLEGLDLQFEITIDDLERYYQDRNAGKNPDEILNSFRGSKEYPVPDGFSLGSMGGFCTYPEILDHLSFMAANYPNLIMPIDTIEGGTTIEGHPVYWTRISDNPQINEVEPEVLYTALIHSREPGSVQQMLFFMYYLLENYNTDDEIRQLVDHTELYFIPCINPDGYIYNESISPDGGGMWRKNRRLNEGGTIGVDLNRNFGYEWGHDNYGSSPSPGSSTYRGTEAFSEPESQIVKTFCEQHEFRIALNYHTYGNYMLHPWGYVSYLYAPDHSLLQTFGKLFTSENHYRYGNVGTLLYIVNGDVNDWMYGEQTTKPKCMAFTPEIGNQQDGFWPEIERIIPQCIESMQQNLLTAQLAGEYILMTDETDFNLIMPVGHLSFSLQQVGLIASDIIVTIEGVGDCFEQIGGPLAIGAIDTMQIITDSISYKLRPGIVPGEALSYVIHIESGNFHLSDTIRKVFGPAVLVFTDSCNNVENWDSPSWDISTYQFHSAPASITDSPDGYYSSSTYSSIQLADTIDLSGAVASWMHFYAKWDLDGGIDYVTCKASSNYGLDWVTLPGRYTITDFVPGEESLPVYTRKQDSWVSETIGLCEFCGEEILIKFDFKSDSKTNKDGFYFDDIVIEKIVAENYSQEIFLPVGWSNLSSYLIPEDLEIEAVFGDIIQDILIVQDGQGFFQPQNPSGTLDKWHTHSGYLIKVSEGVSLQIPGPAEHNRHLELQPGWNLIPVVSSSPIAVLELNIQPVNSFEIILQPIGNKMFWPSKSIQTLDSLYPGHSYFIKMYGAGTIDY